MPLVSKSFSDIITFTRGSNATLVNSAGLIAYAPANMLTYSEQFDNAAWTKTATTITANTVTAPDGTVTADTAETTNATNAVYQTVTVIALMTYTFSFYALRGTATDLKYSVYDVSNAANIVAATSYYASTNASTWSRISVSFTAPAGCTSVRVYANRDSGVLGTAYLWGGAVNPGSTAQPYVGTTSAAYYGPRLDYDPATLLPRGLLIEEQRTNLLTYSEQFDNAAWSKNNVTITANAVTAPDGTTTGDLLTITAVSDPHVRQSAATTETCAYSGYFKKGNDQSAALRVINIATVTTDKSLFYNFDTQVFTGDTSDFLSYGAQVVSNGWVRLYAVRAAQSGQTSVQWRASTSAVVNQTVYLWGAQLE